jgi:hypothetical protein
LIHRLVEQASTNSWSLSALRAASLFRLVARFFFMQG